MIEVITRQKPHKLESSCFGIFTKLHFLQPIEDDKVRDTKMMMNTVRNSIYYLLYINPNMIKFVVCMLYEIMLNTCVTLIYFFIM